MHYTNPLKFIVFFTSLNENESKFKEVMHFDNTVRQGIRKVKNSFENKNCSPNVTNTLKMHLHLA